MKKLHIYIAYVSLVAILLIVYSLFIKPDNNLVYYVTLAAIGIFTLIVEGLWLTHLETIKTKESEIIRDQRIKEVEIEKQKTEQQILTVRAADIELRKIQYYEQQEKNEALKKQIEDDRNNKSEGVG
jgi:hypothetical protein